MLSDKHFCLIAYSATNKTRSIWFFNFLVKLLYSSYYSDLDKCPHTFNLSTKNYMKMYRRANPYFKTKLLSQQDDLMA